MILGKKGQIGSFIILILIAFGVFGGTYYLEATNNPLADSIYDFLSSFTGYSRDMLRSPNGIYFLFFPYLATVAIIFGLFMEIGLFRRIHGSKKEIIYFLIAGMWAMFLIPTGILGSVVVFFYAWSATMAIFLFVIAFIFGSALWARTSITVYRTEYGIIKELHDKREKVERKQSKLTKKFLDEKMSKEEYRRKLHALKEMINDINKRIKTLEETPHH